MTQTTAAHLELGLTGYTVAACTVQAKTPRWQASAYAAIIDDTKIVSCNLRRYVMSMYSLWLHIPIDHVL